MNTNEYTYSKPVRITSQDYSWTQFAVHSVSMVYNVSMELYYNHLLNKAYTMETEYTYEQIQTIKRERLKHTISGVLTGVLLIVGAISYLQNNEREERIVGSTVNCWWGNT